MGGNFPPLYLLAVCVGTTAVPLLLPSCGFGDIFYKTGKRDVFHPDDRQPDFSKIRSFWVLWLTEIALFYGSLDLTDFPSFSLGDAAY